MKIPLPPGPVRRIAFACIAIVAPLTHLYAAADVPPAAAVTVTDNGRSWTLDNGIVKATVTKDSGSMPSLIYKGVEILKASGGTWEHNPQGAPTLTNSISIDPATNGGA